MLIGDEHKFAASSHTNLEAQNSVMVTLRQATSIWSCCCRLLLLTLKRRKQHYEVDVRIPAPDRTAACLAGIRSPAAVALPRSSNPSRTCWRQRLGSTE